jgi:RNA polymerase primary sigma factor
LRDYLAEIAPFPPLSAADERELAHQIARGDPEARERLIVSHLGLVVVLARTYRGHRLPLEDLVSEGNLGLIRAVEGFRAEIGTRFTTYATFWVRQSIRQALHRDRNTIRLPHHLLHLLTEWHRAVHALRRELGRAPLEEEIAARLGLSPTRARGVWAALRVRALGQAPGERDDDTLDLVAGGNDRDPVDALVEEERRCVVADALGSLSDREGAVLRQRFGLGGGDPVTLREVGAQLGCTRERVRQIEQHALSKLRPHLSA